MTRLTSTDLIEANREKLLEFMRGLEGAEQ